MSTVEEVVSAVKSSGMNFSVDVVRLMTAADGDNDGDTGYAALAAAEKEKEKEEKEKEKEKFALCESIGHRPLRGRCPKGR